MIYKRCNNCHQLFVGKCCVSCKAKFSRDNSQKRQNENEARKLYGGYRWSKVRKHIRIKYMDYDIWLLAIGQLYQCKKPYIHHIIERDENPLLVFDEDNLIVVSKESHEEIHKEYLRNKSKALERIRKGIEKYKEIFGND